MTHHSDQVRDNPEARRFEMDIADEKGILTYRRTADRLELLHTEVPEHARGNGLGSTLVEHALEVARADGIRVVPVCPFVRAYVEQHPEYQSLVA